MAKGIIRLCYKKSIDMESKGAWANIFEDTHKEFYMQAQQFDPGGRFLTYQEILTNLPGAEPMQYLVSTAAANYVKSLHGSFYGFQDTLNMASIPIRDFKFELVDSHITDKSKHKVNLYFYSDRMIWIDSSGDGILTADIRFLPLLIKGDRIESRIIPAGDDLSISFFQNFPNMTTNLS